MATTSSGGGLAAEDLAKVLAKPADGIDEVIVQLTGIVQWSTLNDSRFGYFAALYRKVTMQIKKGIQEGHFGAAWCGRLESRPPVSKASAPSSSHSFIPRNEKAPLVDGTSGAS